MGGDLQAALLCFLERRSSELCVVGEPGPAPVTGTFITAAPGGGELAHGGAAAAASATSRP